MKLVRVEIKNYRSIFEGDDAPPFYLDLANGMNALVGVNNCGKSNVLSAIAIALDQEHPFRWESDTPGQMQWANIRITLTFTSSLQHSVDKTLFRRLEQYEQSAKPGGSRTYAKERLTKLQVTLTKSGRTDTFVARGAGNRQGDQELLSKCLSQFYKAVRFVLVESGQSLEDLLGGRFREVLRSVIREHLRDEFQQADEARRAYVESLQQNLLDPLREQVTKGVIALFPEVNGVTLVPSVPHIDGTLSNVEVRLVDAVETSLSSKGTGLRGVVLVAMLQYLSDQSRRSVIFAIEEPEAFLHPGAQENLTRGLESLAVRKDVTLVVTTHSPFIISREKESKVFALSKDFAGRTRLAGDATGAEPRASLLGDLFNDAALPDLIERAAEIPPSASAIVVVEGETDEQYLRLAANKLGRPDLIQDIYIAVAGGATKAVAQALLLRSQTERPLIALFDADELGKAGHKLLIGRFNFQNRKESMTYADVWEPGIGIGVEAEDLFPNSLLATFVDRYGEDSVLEEKIRRDDGDWHFGLNKSGKELVATFIEQNATSADFDRWLTLLELLRTRLGLVLEVEEEDVPEPEETARPPRPSTSQTLSVWPLPGGRGQWFASLISMLEHVFAEGPAQSAATDWLVENFDSVGKASTARGYWQVPRSFGLVSVSDGRLVLTDAGVSVLESNSPTVLLDQLSLRVAGFSEIKQLLTSTPMTSDELLPELRALIGVAWKTDAQVRFRLFWLEELGAAKSEGSTWSIAVD